MSSQPPYGYPGSQGGGYPPPSQPTGKTKVMNLDYNVAGMLCYLLPCLCLADLIFCILWLATEPKESRFVRFHAMQGLLLFGLGFVVAIIFQILGTGVAVTTRGVVEAGGLGLLLLARLLVGLVFLVLYVIGMIKAYQGQMWKLPIIGDIAEKNA